MNSILILIKGLGRGGAEQLLVSAAPYLDTSRFRYEFAYLLPWKDAFVGRLEEAGFPVRCLEGGRGPGWMRRLRKLVVDHHVDLVHVHSPYAAIGARLVVPRGVPLVYTEHNVWQRYHVATYWANVLTYPRNDHVFAVSDEVRSSVRYPGALRLRHMPPVETLLHGPDPDTLAPPSSDGVRRDLGLPEDAPVVGTVANLKPHKGHDNLLRAALRVRETIPEVRFVVVGQGPLEAEIRQRAHDMGLDGTVVFAGYREDAARVLASFDVFVLPSRYEGLSIALLEALAAGKPVVATRVGGTPEVIDDGVTGLLVPPDDAPALAERVVALIRDEPLRTRLGSAGRRRALDFDIRKAIRRTERVYEELLRRS